ncbi:MAG: radical SAM protein [Candidatus Coatesbacteria bacterium]|nr:MAG: radical SAM protein [Candidatus Coatesbacteria bacterium]
MAADKKPTIDRRSDLLAAEVFLSPPPPAAAGELRAALCYPNSYRVGMASLGFQLVWGAAASHPAFAVERYFASYAGRAPRGLVPNPRGLERGTPLAEADVIAFAAYYEPDYLRLYGMLQGGGVRPWAAERGEYDPFVVVGGPAATANAEPVAPFADAVVLGDAEEAWPALLEAVAAHAGAPRRAVLREFAGIAGVYVPSLYKALYGAPGSPVAIAPKAEAPPYPSITRLGDLSPYRGGSWIATSHAEFGKLLLLEPIRGCGRGCAFCETTVISSPPRERRLESLEPLVEEAAGVVKKVGLVGAAVADYNAVGPLARDVVERGMLLSVSSLALASPGTTELLQALGASGQRGVALAPEAATEEGRARLGKPLPPGRLEAALEEAATAGLSKIKLYYVVGAPGETKAEVAAIGEELARLNGRFRTLTLEARVNPLVPKPRTPLAAAALLSRADFRRLLGVIKAKARGAKVVGGSWREAKLQADLGKGDRTAARWIAHAAERA